MKTSITSILTADAALFIHLARKWSSLPATLLIALFGTAGMAATAKASSLVTGNARGWSTYDYNVNQTGSHLNLSPNSTAFGTTDATGTATEITGTATGSPGPDGSGQRLFTTSTLHMASSLAHASVTNTEYDTGLNHFFTGDDGGTLVASWSDQLHFTVPGATASTVTTIHVDLRQTGHMLQSGSNTEQPSSAAARTATQFTIPSANFGLQVGLNDFGFGSTAGASLGSGLPPGWTISSMTPNLFDVSGDFTITGPSGSIPMTLYMSTFSRDGMDTDLTANVLLGLPGGVQMTSDSGVFGSGVPEPSTWAMLGLGLPALLAFRSRRSAQA